MLQITQNLHFFVAVLADIEDKINRKIGAKNIDAVIASFEIFSDFSGAIIIYGPPDFITPYWQSYIDHRYHISGERSFSQAWNDAILEIMAAWDISE